MNHKTIKQFISSGVTLDFLISQSLSNLLDMVNPYCVMLKHLNRNLELSLLETIKTSITFCKSNTADKRKIVEILELIAARLDTQLTMLSSQTDKEWEAEMLEVFAGEVIKLSSLIMNYINQVLPNAAIEQ